MFLDSGNTHFTDHYSGLLKAILSKYKDQLHNGNLILRTDSDFSSSDNVEKLLSIPKLKFITKGYSTRTASTLASVYYSRRFRLKCWKQKEHYS